MGNLPISQEEADAHARMSSMVRAMIDEEGRPKGVAPCMFPEGCYPEPEDCEYWRRGSLTGCARARDEARQNRLSCPTHGKSHMIGFHSQSMWHPSTGEPKPDPIWTFTCRAIIKKRRFLFWQWEVRCPFTITSKEAVME